MYANKKLIQTRQIDGLVAWCLQTNKGALNAFFGRTWKCIQDTLQLGTVFLLSTEKAYLESCMESTCPDSKVSWETLILWVFLRSVFCVLFHKLTAAMFCPKQHAMGRYGILTWFPKKTPRLESYT